MRKFFYLCIVIIFSLILVGCDGNLSNREYYCDSTEHILDKENKTCSYIEEADIIETYECEDDVYKVVEDMCVFPDLDLATRVEDKDGFIDYQCPDGFVATGLVKVCMPKDKKDAGYEDMIPAKKVDTRCPDDYEKMTVSDYYTKKNVEVTPKDADGKYYTDENGNYDSSDGTGYTRKKKNRTICGKEITYEAKWKEKE